MFDSAAASSFISAARGDGHHARLLKNIARTDLLILDDWGLSVLTQNQRIELLEILEDRNGRGSTIVTSQIPVDLWFDVIGDPTIADACLDRLVHYAHRLDLKETACAESAASDRLSPPPPPEPIKPLSVRFAPAHHQLKSAPTIDRNWRLPSLKCAARSCLCIFVHSRVSPEA